MPIANESQNGSQVAPHNLSGPTLRMMRNEHRVSLRELAALVGISASHLSRVESGERPVSPSLVERVCDAIATLPVAETKESA